MFTTFTSVVSCCGLGLLSLLLVGCCLGFEICLLRVGLIVVGLLMLGLF